MTTDGSIFTCPRCGAAQESQGLEDRVAVTCPYCSTSIVVPGHLRRGRAGSSPTRGPLGIIVGVSALTALLVVGGLAFVFWPKPNPSPPAATLPVRSAAVASAPAPESSAPTPDAEPSPLLAKLGGKGKVPGKLNDPRALAIDREGNLYVGDFVPARLQKLDANGKFLLQLSIEKDNTTLTDVATDSLGNVLAVYGGSIYKYSGSDGKLLSTIAGSQHRYFQRITVVPTNAIYAVALAGKETDVYRIDPQGRILARYAKPFRRGNENRGLLSAALVVDSEGKIYAKLQRNTGLVTLDEHGKYLNQIDVNQLCKADIGSAIALDSKERLVLGSGRAVSLCTRAGKFVSRTQFPRGEGAVRRVAVAPDGSVYVTTNDDHILKLRLSE